MSAFYYIGYQIPYYYSNSSEYILVGNAGDLVYINDAGALASAGPYLNLSSDGYFTIGSVIRIAQTVDSIDSPPDGYGYLYQDTSGNLHFKNDSDVDVVLGSSTPGAHAESHECGESDALDGYNLCLEYTPTNYSAPSSNIIGLHIAAIDTVLGSSGLVDSVFGRTGTIVATTDDYAASEIDNDSTCTGEQVSDALEYLDGYIKDVSLLTVGGDLSGTLPNPTVTDLSIASEEQGSVLYFDGANWVQLAPGDDGYALVTHSTGANPTWSSVEAAAAPVDSVFGRTGAITAASDDYSASQIDNDSTVTGEQVSDALEYLDGYIKDVSDDLNVHELDTNNPHSTSIANIVAGTLAELNTAVSDATLDDAGSPRDPNAHADTHIADGDDELDGYNLAIDYTPTNYSTPTNGIIGEHIAAIDGALGSSGTSGTSIWYSSTPGTTEVPIPATATTLSVVVVGGGGGGGGAGHSSSSDIAGAPGGGSGAVTFGTFSAAGLYAIATTLSVTVGAGGAGGDSVSGGASGGAKAGDSGTDSTIAHNSVNIVIASGGAGAGAAGPGAGGIFGSLSGQTGGTTSTTTDGAAPLALTVPQIQGTGAGGGGGSNKSGGGMGGVGGYVTSHDPGPGAAAGAAGGDPLTTGGYWGRGGGGGGGRSTAYSGSDGGAGQTPGGGGGGGGASRGGSGYSGGNGGAGGAGMVLLIWN